MKCLVNTHFKKTFSFTQSRSNSNHSSCSVCFLNSLVFIGEAESRRHRDKRELHFLLFLQCLPRLKLKRRQSCELGMQSGLPYGRQGPDYVARHCRLPGPRQRQGAAAKPGSRARCCNVAQAAVHTRFLHPTI